MPATHPRSETCRDARRGLRWYQARARYWAHKMGAATQARFDSSTLACPRLLLLAKHARQAAHAARVRYERWSYQWEWRRWLPDKWRRIGTCETGLRWDWNSGTYQGAFGFYWGSWDAYKPRGFPAEAYQATPRQQWIVAERIRAAVGYGAWGCGGA